MVFCFEIRNLCDSSNSRQEFFYLGHIEQLRYTGLTPDGWPDLKLGWTGGLGLEHGCPIYAQSHRVKRGLRARPEPPSLQLRASS
jgi:hypothetical protein